MKTKTQWLFETPSTLETISELDPYSALGFAEDWQVDELTPTLEGELEGIVNSVFSKIGDVVDWGKAQFMVRKAILAGNRDENQLTNLVFFARHPERQGRKISKTEPNFLLLSQEWKEIRDRLVRPALTQIATPSTTPTTNIKWGVPGGIITSPFHRNRQEKVQIVGKSSGRDKHFGIDVTGALSGGKQGTAEDSRRGLRVYATIKPVISLSTLNNIRVAVDKTGAGRMGLGIPGQGDAILKNALVLVQPWNPKKAKPENVIPSWGGVVGLACRYTYGSQKVFTLYIEYLHLITEDFLPINQRGKALVTVEQWQAMGKPIGFGPRMQQGTILSASELTGKNPLLVGYLGATSFPHVHIQANYRHGEGDYQFFPRFDPTVMIS
jgi:hypothetical protein